MELYKLEKHTEKENYWVITDTQNHLTCVFEQNNFNNNQKFTELYDSTNPLLLAKYARQMTDWLVLNYPELV